MAAGTHECGVGPGRRGDGDRVNREHGRHVTEGKAQQVVGSAGTSAAGVERVGIVAPGAADLSAGAMTTGVTVTPLSPPVAAMASTVTLTPSLSVAAETLALPGALFGLPTIDSERLPTVTIRGQRFHALTEAQVISHVLRELKAGRGGWVITPNVDHLRRLSRDPSLRALYARADLVVADGMPLIWASRLRGTPLPERVAGSSLLSTLSQAAAASRRSVYFLGGDEGTAAASARLLKERYSGLEIAGLSCPAAGFEKNPGKLEALAGELIKADPDIVYVALGSPKQEWLIDRLRQRLPRAWWLGIGISFSLLCGRLRRAPRWMQHVGLEWLHRLFQEPKRLARRYLMQGLPFALGLLATAPFERKSVQEGLVKAAGPSTGFTRCRRAQA
jgi:N-acetylglucosaminyldiphosphoundecaprenol N-acetyl-beta-D-mannosaminyltransferase